MSNTLDQSPAQNEEQPEIESRIIEVAPPPPPSLYEGMNTPRERVAALRAYFGEKKKELTERLAEVEGVTVKDLAATGTLIVTAERSKWAALTGQGGALDIDGLSIHENTLVHRTK
jgi:hypothetical protein